VYASLVSGFLGVLRTGGFILGVATEVAGVIWIASVRSLGLRTATGWRWSCFGGEGGMADE
jgi:hypothetical protein